MKQIIIFKVFLFQSMILLCGQVPQSSFNISIGAPEISKITLSKLDFTDSQMKIVKQIEAVEGKKDIRFNLPFQEAGIYVLKVGNAQELRIAIESAGILEIAIGEQIKLSSTSASVLEFDKSIQQLNVKIFAELMKAYEKAAAEQDQEKLKALEKEKDVLLLEFEKEMEDLVREMGPSAKAFDALAYFDLYKHRDFIEEMLSKFQARFPQWAMSLALQKMLDRAKLLDLQNKAPNFAAHTLEGAPISLESYQGKYLLLDFWASWCQACRVENPKFVKLYREYKSKDFEILSISIDKQKEICLKAIQKDQLTWNQIIDPEFKLYKLYYLSSLPSNFLLDKEGKIIARNLNAEELEAHLGKLH